MRIPQADHHLGFLARRSVPAASRVARRAQGASDLLGDLARFKTRELSIKASAMGAHAALVATTRTNAELLDIDGETGTIEPGKVAEVAVLNEDFFDAKKVPDEGIKKIRSVMTIVQGKVVHGDGKALVN